MLAFEATKLGHGEAAAHGGRGNRPPHLRGGRVGEDLPTVEVRSADLSAGIPVVDLLVGAELAAIQRRSAPPDQGNGARLNDAVVADTAATVGAADAVSGVIKLSAGKKRHALVRAK